MIYLGIDCGTQSLKVVAWDPEKGLLASSAAAYGLLEGLPPGHKEQHPSVWIEALQACLRELKGKLDLSGVAGIGVSGQQHGLVILDAEDRVIRPAKLWNDTSTAPQCEEILEAAGGEEEYRREIGNALPPGFTASKIRWVRGHEPEAYRRIRWILLPHDYLNWYLTGERVAEAGDASGTGYFSVPLRQWSQRALSWIDPDRDLSECLPRLIESQQSAGRLRARLAEEWGLPSRVVVSSGGGDNMMGAIGSGNVRPGIVTVSLGTSGTLYSYSQQPVLDPRGEIAAFCDSTGGWLPLGCTMNVTVATEMVRSNFLQADHAALDRAVAAVPAGSEGLLLLPYLEGERLPDVPAGTGVLLGLRPATATPSHLARAAMEGVTLGLYYGMERMKELGIRPGEIRLIGGGARSPVWLKMVASVFRLPVVCPRSQEGPAFGAALQALWCHQGEEIADLADRYVELDDATRVEPDPEQAAVYEALYELFQAFSRTLTGSDLFQRHRQFIEREE